MLRHSALRADSIQAQAITTMENADVDSIIMGVAGVIRAYTREASVDARSNDAPQGAGAAFDEVKYPLDRTGVWRRAPKTLVVEEFVRRVVDALELDESSVVLGLILLERAMTTKQSKEDGSGAPLPLSARTWRPALLMAIVVASKVVYDEKVFLADYREMLPMYNLTLAPQQELAFLDLVAYNTTVRRGQYARYYYALEDVSKTDWASSSGSRAAAF